MNAVEQKIAEVTTEILQAVADEAEQVKVLIQQNEPTHAIQALENMKARVLGAIKEIAPDTPAEETPASNEEPPQTAPVEESTLVEETKGGDDNITGSSE